MFLADRSTVQVRACQRQTFARVRINGKCEVNVIWAFRTLRWEFASKRMCFSLRQVRVSIHQIRSSIRLGTAFQSDISSGFPCCFCSVGPFVCDTRYDRVPLHSSLLAHLVAEIPITLELLYRGFNPIFNRLLVGVVHFPHTT